MANKEFDVEKINRLIGINGLDIEYSPIIDSTSSAARRHVLAGGKTPRVFIASEQIEGRGRLGRSFYSPADTGVYFSILFADNGERDTVLMTTAAAVAIRRAILNVTGVSTEIKWVNDLYYQSKKVCGILTEGAIDPATGQLQYAVVGIGVNVTPPDGGFPDEIRHIAGAILPAADDAEAMRDMLAEKIVCGMMMLLDADPASVHEKYRSRLVLRDRAVTVHAADGSSSRPATALDIDEDYRLIVRYADGTFDHLDSGEVSVR
jgi:BirA family biotin operon repressor/biotin-[acetyl-CoA-carboxylase] ligase